MAATEILRAEHEGIQTMLDILGKLAEEAEAGTLDPIEAERTMDFFRQFADRCHHGKEEKELFPALEGAGVPREGGPVGVMLAEHELGRAAVRTMVAALASLAGGKGAGAKAFAAAAGDYRAILSGHIAKENGVLFPLADRVLSPGEQERLTGAFDRIEAEEMGAGTHERYHAMIEELAARHLRTAGHVCG